MFKFFKKTDSDIEADIIKELDWDPSVDATRVAVTVKDGIATLTGSVPHYSAKTAVETITRRIAGVRAVANELDVDIFGVHARSDTEIAQSALNVLGWTYGIPSNLSLSVENGWITLHGETDWSFEREAAEKAVSSLMGVRGVNNRITLRSRIVDQDVKRRIEEALKRQAADESRKINVTVAGNQVTLSGKVHSNFEAAEAALAAWNAPGVVAVQNNITVGSTVG